MVRLSGRLAAHVAAPDLFVNFPSDIPGSFGHNPTGWMREHNSSEPIEPRFPVVTIGA
jgi:hypothetical protein